MIAGTPTSVGTIVDVEEQTGNYLIAVEKAELDVEVCEAPIASKKPVVEPEPTDSDKVAFSEMTKSQIETYGRSLRIELDKRQNKTTLIAELEAYIS